MLQTLERPKTFTCFNGDKAVLPFSQAEYDRRLTRLRALMAENDIDVVLFTSMHNIAYYSGFLYCSFGRSYGCIVDHEHCTVVSANIDGGQPWRRSHGENVIYTDWNRDNYWHAVRQLIGSAKRVGFEADHLTVAGRDALQAALNEPDLVDIAGATMAARMIKSEEEQALIRSGAAIADIGGAAVRDAIKLGAREIDIAMAGRNAMELAIAERRWGTRVGASWGRDARRGKARSSESVLRKALRAFRSPAGRAL